MSELHPFSGDHTGEYALIAAALLAMSHLIGPWLRNNLERHTVRLISFGDGLAVAYVFLQLVPEIEHAHELVGDRIHILILFSFLLFFGLEMRLLHRHHSMEETERSPNGDGAFWLHIALTWIYTWMIVFALPGEVTSNLGYAIVGSLAIGLHLIYKGYVLVSHHKTAFETRGRYVLAVAPIAGWVAHVVAQPSEFVFDVFIALMAGFLMQGVFREELPAHDRTRLHWMVAGAVVFLILDIVAP